MYICFWSFFLLALECDTACERFLLLLLLLFFFVKQTKQKKQMLTIYFAYLL